jgi:cell division protein FtsX
MKYLSVKLDSDLKPSERNSVVADIRHISGVFGVEASFPDEKKGRLKSMFSVSVRDADKLDAVAKEIRGIEGVASASVPRTPKR